MINLIYTYKEGPPPRDGSGIIKTVRVYRFRKGRPELIILRSDTFVSEEQLVLEALHQAKRTLKGHRLPDNMFERNAMGGWMAFSTLLARGIANINRVD